MDWKRALQRAWQDPKLASDTLRGLLRGFYYRVKFRLLGRRVEIGRFFRVNGPLDIRGPGRVIFGDHCSVQSSRLRPTTPYTHSRDAVIQFGDRVLLTRTRLGCQNRIEVGNDSGLAECSILDTDFHAVQAGADGPRYNTGAHAKPILIGTNVWVGQSAMVLKGVRIGANAIVGAGAVVAHNVPEDAVVFGNPARVVWWTRRKPKTDAAASAGAPPQRRSG